MTSALPFTFLLFNVGATVFSILANNCFSNLNPGLYTTNDLFKMGLDVETVEISSKLFNLIEDMLEFKLVVLNLLMKTKVFESFSVEMDLYQPHLHYLKFHQDLQSENLEPLFSKFSSLCHFSLVRFTWIFSSVTC